MERLFKIADILEVKVAALMGIETNEVYNQENKEGSSGYMQKIANFYQDNKEAYESHIATLKEENAFLRGLVNEKMK